MKKIYDSKFDIIKLILSLFVVLVHTDTYQYIVHPWIKLTVPLFFIISSYFLFKKINTVNTKEERKQIYKMYLLRTIKLYFFWFIILLPMVLYNNRTMTFENGSMGFIEHAIKRLFLGSTYQASWYMSASIFGVIIIAFLSSKLSNKKLFTLCLIPFTLVVIWTCYLPFFKEDGIVNTFYDIYYRVLSNPHHSFPASLIWLTVGKCFADKTFTLNKLFNFILLLVSGILLYLEWHLVGKYTSFYESEGYFLMLPFCIAIFGLILNIKPFTFKGSIYLKRLSTYIYVIHGTLIPSINYLVYKIINLNHNVYVFLIDIILCTIIYIIAQLIINTFNNKLTKIMKYSY